MSANRKKLPTASSPSLGLPFEKELVVDLFAGGGGASAGIARAYREPDVDVNLIRRCGAFHDLSLVLTQLLLTAWTIAVICITCLISPSLQSLPVIGGPGLHMPTMQMTYIVPAAIKCSKSDYKGHGQLITTRAVYCPQCFDDFIRQHVPVLVPEPEGKPFDPNSLTVNL